MPVTINGTTGIAGVDGSASTPAVQGTDTNTGIFFPAADTIAFGEGGTEVMRIDSSGNVGINTTAPSSKLDISTGGSTGTTDMITLSGLDSGSAKQTYGVIRMGIENNTAGAEQGNLHLQTVESGTVRDRIYMKGGGEIAFYNGGTERARITSDGFMLVGATSTAQGSGNGNKLVPNGGLYVVNAATNDGFSYYNSTAGAYRFYVGSNGTINATNTTISAISDQRFKENIRDLDDGLNLIIALKPRKFDWKEGKGKDIKDDRGFIAQEFEQVFPDLIDEWKDPAPEGEEPYKSVRQDLIPVLVKAIQELNAKVETLEAQNAAFEARLAALEAK